jgi:hypothetical protein
MKSGIFFVVACMLILTASITSGYEATFEPSISVGEEYTDNYFLTENNKKHEYTTILSPAFTATIRAKTSGADISYTPSYAAHDNYDEDDTWRHSAYFKGWVDIAKNTRLDLTDSFLYTEDPTTEEEYTAEGEPITKGDTTIRKGRQTYYRNDSRLQFTQKIGTDDFINFGYSHYFLENDDPTYEDSERHNPFVGLTCWFGRQWGLEIIGDYIKGEFDSSSDALDPSDDFDNWRGGAKITHNFTKQFAGYVGFDYTNMDYEEQTDDYQVYAPTIGITYMMDEDTNFSLGVGYFYQSRDEFDNEDGIILNGDLGKTWRFRRASIKLTGSSGYEESYFDAENLGFDVFYQILCRATYDFTRRIKGDILSSYRRDNYVNRDPDPDREDVTTKIGAGLTLELERWISINFRYAYRTVNSDIGSNDYDENSVFCGITLHPSFPFRTLR